jgi:hypothetical protein
MRPAVGGRLVIAAGVLALAACDAGGHAAHRAEAPEGYAEVMQGFRERGRGVVEQLRDGDIGAVYDAASPDVKAQVSLADVEAIFAEVTATAPIGSIAEERVIAINEQRAIYFVDHEWGDERLRFTVTFDDGFATPMVEPSPPVPDVASEGSVQLRLPFDGTWWVSEGPTPLLGNHHAVASDQTYAYDFSVWRDGGTSRGDGSRNDDYWAWDQPVLAPAVGTVVEVVDGLADNRPVVEADPGRPAGNHVIIDVGDGQYAVLAHFRKGSIEVARGDRVKSGDRLGRVGNSGNSFEPHVHLHVQDAPTFEPGVGHGIAIDFGPHWADGEQVDSGPASGGQFVEPDHS